MCASRAATTSSTGAEAEVNMKTGVSRLISGTGGRVQGLIVPNEPRMATGGAEGHAETGRPPRGRKP